MQVLLTRPLAQSRAMAEILALCDHKAIISPLLHIVPLAWDFPEAQIDALVLTSQNAVPQQHLDALKNIPAYCIGAASAEAARAAGLAVAGDANGDRAALVTLLAAHKPQRALFLSGHTERADLIAELAAVGVPTLKRTVYRADATALSALAIDAISENKIDWALLFSPRSAALFASHCNALTALQKNRLRLACLSSAVAEACGADWAHVTIAAQPSTAHLLAAAGLLCDRAATYVRSLS